MLAHQAKYNGHTLECSLPIDDGVVQSGAARQAGEKGSLGEIEPADALVEVDLGGRLRAVRQVTVEDAVQVIPEDLALGETLADLIGQRHLLRLTGQGPLIVEHVGTDELLGDGACSGDDVAVAP